VLKQGKARCVCLCYFLLPRLCSIEMTQVVSVMFDVRVCVCACVHAHLT